MSLKGWMRCVAALLPLIVLPAFVGAPTAMVEECAGSGLSGDAKWIKCTGECPGQTCRVGTSSDADGTYKYCGCAGDSGSPVEPSCCHLVARRVDGVTVLGVRGLCTKKNPACADTDGLTCQLVNDQPVCRL